MKRAEYPKGVGPELMRLLQVSLANSLRLVPDLDEATID